MIYPWWGSIIVEWVHTLSARALVLIMMMRWYALQTNRKSPHFLEPRHMYYSITYALRKGGRQMVRSICSQPNGLARIGTFYLDVLHLTRAQQPKRTRGNRSHTCSDEMPPISCELCAHVKCVLFHWARERFANNICLCCVFVYYWILYATLCKRLFNLVSFRNHSVENDCVCFSCDSQPKAINNKWYL